MIIFLYAVLEALSQKRTNMLELVPKLKKICTFGTTIRYFSYLCCRNTTILCGAQ